MLCKIHVGHERYFTSEKLSNYLPVSKLFRSLRYHLYLKLSISIAYPHEFSFLIDVKYDAQEMNVLSSYWVVNQLTLLYLIPGRTCHTSKWLVYNSRLKHIVSLYTLWYTYLFIQGLTKYKSQPPIQKRDLNDISWGSA